MPEPEPKLLSPWPLARLPGWVRRVNEPLTAPELEAVRRCAHRGQPLGDDCWVESIARRLRLESTMRPRGRPRVHFPSRTQTKRPDPFVFLLTPLFFSVKAQLVKLRIFAGLSHQEAAKELGISRQTADRFWAYAKDSIR